MWRVALLLCGTLRCLMKVDQSGLYHPMYFICQYVRTSLYAVSDDWLNRLNESASGLLPVTAVPQCKESYMLTAVSGIKGGRKTNSALLSLHYVQLGVAKIVTNSPDSVIFYINPRPSPNNDGQCNTGPESCRSRRYTRPYSTIN